MTTIDLDAYRHLFVHRCDVYAEQQPDGSYRPIKAPLSDNEIAEHLAGFASYGVYVIEPECVYDPPLGKGEPGSHKWYDPNTVKYLVFDLDTYSPEAYEWLVECLTVLINTLHGTTTNPRHTKKCLLMENSGGKGFHAWLFLEQPTPAFKVRRWVARDFVPMWNERASSFDGTPLEIFPKQDEVKEGKFGNLVKLPLGVHAKSGKHSDFVPEQDWASGVDNVQMLDVSLIPDIPREEVSAPNLRSGMSGQGSNPAPFACISQIIADGVGRGNRDNAMFHFAQYAKGTGIPEDLLLDWCFRVNDGFDPPLTTVEVNTKLRSALAMNSPHPGCNADWLKGFCPGGERCFAPWNEDKPARAGTVEVPDSYLEMTSEQRREARLRRE